MCVGSRVTQVSVQMDRLDRVGTTLLRKTNLMVGGGGEEIMETLENLRAPKKEVTKKDPVISIFLNMCV